MSRGNKNLIYIFAAFLAFYYIPFDKNAVSGAIHEAFLMAQDYAKNHMLLSLIPAFFISGAISVFFSKNSVMKYLGSGAGKAGSYAIASVSGAVLTVCSCTIIPIFGSIYKRGAGFGPAIAFLYAVPALNILAIILTARVLGWELGVARAIGAVLFAVIIGLTMGFMFRKEEQERVKDMDFEIGNSGDEKPAGITLLFFLVLFGILIFLSWAKDSTIPYWDIAYKYKFPIAAVFFIFLILILLKWFNKKDIADWAVETRRLVLDIMPLLFIGAMIAGFFLGRPGHSGILPESLIFASVGDNSLKSNFIASITGGLMYFCTLMEVPVLQGLMGSGMHKGPALALLLAWPSISLPSYTGG